MVSDDCYCKYEADCQFKFPEGHIHYIHIIEFEKNLSVTQLYYYFFKLHILIFNINLNHETGLFQCQVV